MRGIKKQHLPTKICPTCGRAFAWRKKWSKDWESVRYCGDRCRTHRPGLDRIDPARPAS